MRIIRKNYMNLILMILSKAFGLVSWPFKAFSSLVTTNPKGALFTAVLVCVLFAGWRIDRYVVHLEQKTEVAKKDELHAIEDKNKLQEQLNLATTINAENQRVITMMQEDAIAKTKQVSELNATLATSAKTYSGMLEKISKTPKVEDGPVAPVLSNAVNDIQLQRGQK